MLHTGQVVGAHRKRSRVDLVPLRIGELEPFADAGFEQWRHRLIACFVQQPVEIEAGQEAVRSDPGAPGSAHRAWYRRR